MSRKRLDLKTPFQRTTNRKWHMGYQIVTCPMTSRDLRRFCEVVRSAVLATVWLLVYPCLVPRFRGPCRIPPSIPVPVTEGEDVNGAAKCCVPWAVNLEQFTINCANSSLSLGAFKGRLKTYKFLRSWTMMNTIRRYWGVFVIMAPSINVPT